MGLSPAEIILGKFIDVDKGLILDITEDPKQVTTRSAHVEALLKAQTLVEKRH